jgi:glutathione S-transferase
VPVLELDDGVCLTEVPAIVQYIADRIPESGLAPRPYTLERYQLQEWLGFISSELHKAFVPLFKPDTPEEYKRIIRENLASRLNYVAARLDGQDYLLGDQFTVADGYCLPSSAGAAQSPLTSASGQRCAPSRNA